MKIVISIFFLGAVFWYFGSQNIRSLTHFGQIASEKLYNKDSIANIDLYKGTIVAIKSDLSSFQVNRNSTPLNEGDSLEIGNESWVRIEFKSGLDIKFLENSKIALETVPSENGNHVYLTLIRGEYEILAGGHIGRVTLVQGMDSFDPAKKSVEQKPNIQNVRRKEASLPKSETPDLTDNDTPQKPNYSKIIRNSKTSLTNDYILSVIRGQKAFFDRCYAEHLKNNPNTQGQINYSFTISPNGEIVQIQKIISSVRDQELESCTESVLKRCRFKKFAGSPIIVNYPIRFE